MALVVLDSSVLIAFLSASDAHHESARRALTGGGTYVTPASAYAEVMVHPLRAGASEARRIDRFFDDLPVRVDPVDRGVARLAAALRTKRRSLRLPDALVLALGDVLDADAVLTADARWSGTHRRVRLI